MASKLSLEQETFLLLDGARYATRGRSVVSGRGKREKKPSKVMLEAMRAAGIKTVGFEFLSSKKRFSMIPLRSGKSTSGSSARKSLESNVASSAAAGGGGEVGARADSAEAVAVLSRKRRRPPIKDPELLATCEDLKTRTMALRARRGRASVEHLPYFTIDLLSRIVEHRRIHYIDGVNIASRDTAAFNEMWEVEYPKCLAEKEEIAKTVPGMARTHSRIEAYLALTPAERVELCAVLKVKPSMGKGFGLFTRGLKSSVAIRAGTVIGEYSGLIRYIPEGSKKDASYKSNHYLFSIGDEAPLIDWVVDAKEAGNLFRMINHAKEGSVDHNVNCVFYPTRDAPRLIIIAAKDIPGDTELGFPYGERYWEEIDGGPVE